MQPAPQSSRLAIVDKNRCKHKKCKLECKAKCPINRAEKVCIKVSKEGGCQILEVLCIGCGACVKSCPYHAIQIVNLPKAVESETIHRYNRNGFMLARLPYPRPGQVLGLVGQNGIGKSTIFSILTMKIRPNLGQFNVEAANEAEWESIARKFRGSELQNYFNQSISGNLKFSTKPQYVDQITKMSKEQIGTLLKPRDELGKLNFLLKELELEHFLDRTLQVLSGGELQRFALCMACLKDAGAFFFDEPSSYLDIGQRMRASRVIRSCLKTGEKQNYVIVIEHDLAILDYISDYVSILYGSPAAFGIVSAPFSCHEGINNFLRGEVPTENVRFRNEELIFRITDDEEFTSEQETRRFNYPSMEVTLDSFKLEVEGANFRVGEIIVILGRNGVGKSTFCRLLSRNLPPTLCQYAVPEFSISYKPQKLQAHYDGTVENLLQSRIQQALSSPLFKDAVLDKLQLEPIMERKVKKLSGGELQRVAIAIALGKNADIYVIDEPSAFLDAEQRVIIAKIIKRYVMNMGKTAFIVEHDFLMATYLATRVMTFDGTPAVSTIAKQPKGVFEGINNFLKQMDVTIRADKNTHRPRINKYLSNLDKDQKSKGQYFVLE